jgi:NTP pyrophosphatase (non-canonical NTP hydrolase)
MEYKELEKLVIKWANEKEILTKGNKMSQALKTLEEVGELINSIHKDDKIGACDDLGDILVTIIIQSEMQGLKLEDCLLSAYNVISKRNGKMIGGQFVKDK